MKKHLLLLFMLFTYGLSFAQNGITVKGKITESSTGEPVIGASVVVKGSQTGTSSSIDGTFTLSNVPGNATLRVSYLGMKAVEIPVNGQTDLEIILSEDSQLMDEVVVVGYGSLRRSQISGSVSKIGADELNKQPVLTAVQGLQGKAAGIQVISSGTPGAQPEVRIRGTNSILTSANPIYIVDGIITDNMSNISTADIVSMEVLKDASSQAIYGSRAANGVIIVTTKSGRTGAININFDTYVGFRTMTSKIKLADATTYARYTNEALKYDNNPERFDLKNLPYDTDWYDAITRNGLVQNYDLNLSGGTDKVLYYFSANYFEDEGILPDNKYKRLIVRNNNEYNISKRLKFGHLLNLSISDSKNQPNSVFAAAYRIPSTAPVKNPDGSYGYESSVDVGNPVATMEYNNDYSSLLRLQGNVFGEVKILDPLRFKSSFNFDLEKEDITRYTPEYLVSSIQKNDKSTLTKGIDNSFNYIWDNLLDYEYTFNEKHEINAMAGFSAERTKTYDASNSIRDVPADKNLWYISQGDINTLTATDGGRILTRESFYGRLNYTYDWKYSINGVIRRDGSSAFPKNEKWGTFYSFGASWVLSQEEFIKNLNIFHDLRLRAGYGKLGNDKIAQIYNVSTLNPITIIQDAYDFSGGKGAEVSPGQTINRINNPSTSWEITKGLDFGLEFGLFDGRLTGEVVYYDKLIEAYVPITLPAASGASGNIITRAADVRNNGAEFTINWNTVVNKDFKYNVGFNITSNRNNVEKVNGGMILKDGGLGVGGYQTTYTVVDQPIGAFWVYENIGIYRTDEDLKKYPALANTKLGDPILKDNDDNGIIDDNDRIFVGSYQPKLYYGLNLGFTWKNIDFSMDCYGNAGNKLYNGKKNVRIGNDNIEMSRAENRWSPDNPNGTNPRASNKMDRPSTYYIESGDFFRINNIALGYNMPQSFCNKMKVIQKMRFYISAQNPVIFKKYSGFTPEVPGQNQLSAGLDLNSYPVPATYMAGLNISF